MARGVDPVSDRPVYKQIADELRRRIETGRIAPGERLPSESALVAEFGVAHGTIRQAIQLLRSEGLAVAEHGRGVFVRNRPPIRRLAHDRFSRKHREAGKAAYLAEAERENAQPRVDVYFVGPETADTDVAQRLKIRKGSKVLARRRRYLSDGEPTELATSFIPWDLAKGTPMTEINPGPGGVYARIEDAGRRLGRFTEEVSARMPTPDEARALRLAAGTPVLTLVRVAYDVEDQPVEMCDTVMSAEHFVLNYELPAD
ncbi:GntR family transcriptional regulator [Nocardioides caldifontis]|uniref:GntR family transcriptional regulator n=1 Tax=Nocardioides caldifontis TaxID=2588938 RepID=UPI0011E026BF|nr:GntR family transcriptional regulator [Nocardioides caldifontis]